MIEIFITLMAVGLAGLLFMALPGMSGHSHAAGHMLHSGGGGHGMLNGGHSGVHALAAGHSQAGHAAAVPAHGSPAGAAIHGAHPSQAGTGSEQSSLVSQEQQAGLAPIHTTFPAWLIPNPSAIFSFLALYGVSGYVLTLGIHIYGWAAAVIGLVPAVLIERVVVAPLWKFLFRFQGTPDAALEELIMEDCEAVTPFHNGRGIVKIVRDGRVVQFSAHLKGSQLSLPIGVGTKMRIEDIDSATERVTVSLG